MCVVADLLPVIVYIYIYIYIYIYEMKETERERESEGEEGRVGREGAKEGGEIIVINN